MYYFSFFRRNLWYSQARGWSKNLIICQAADGEENSPTQSSAGNKGFRRRHHLQLFWFCTNLFLITLKSISSLITFASGLGELCHADLPRHSCILWQSVSHAPVEFLGMPPRDGGVAQLLVPRRENSQGTSEELFLTAQKKKERTKLEGISTKTRTVQRVTFSPSQCVLPGE